MRSLVRWEPFNDLISLRDAMDRLFEESFIRPSRSLEAVSTNPLPVDMFETDEAVVIKASVPGVNPQDIEVTVQGDTLNIKGESKGEEEVERENYYYREVRYGSFNRALSLPAGIDADKAEASFENGVLTLTLPKAEEVKPKSIKIIKK